MMADLGIAEIRAEGRRLVAEYRRVTESPREYYERVAAGSRWAKWVQLHADVLLADPAPVGLTEKELRLVSDARELAPPNPDYPIPWDRYLLARLVAIIDRLSAAPVDDRERVPEGWRVEWIECRHYRPEESHPVPRLIEIVPSCEGHRRLVPVSPSVDPEEKP